jgi:hypothetical protein
MANRLYNKQVSPKGYMGGGRVKKAGGGKLKMVTNKKGEKVPFYAADGVGKMKKGGIAKLNPGLKAYMMKKKKTKKK